MPAERGLFRTRAPGGELCRSERSEFPRPSPRAMLYFLPLPLPELPFPELPFPELPFPELPFPELPLPELAPPVLVDEPPPALEPPLDELDELVDVLPADDAKSAT